MEVHVSECPLTSRTTAQPGQHSCRYPICGNYVTDFTKCVDMLVFVLFFFFTFALDTSC